MKTGYEIDRFWYDRKGCYDKLFYQVESVLVVAQEEVRRSTLPTSRYTTKPDIEIRWMK